MTINYETRYIVAPAGQPWTGLPTHTHLGAARRALRAGQIIVECQVAVEGHTVRVLGAGNILEYSPAAGRPGAVTLPGPLGSLARAMGGLAPLCAALGNVAPSTVRRWAQGERQIPGPAQVLLQTLYYEHGILSLAALNATDAPLSLGGERLGEDVHDNQLWLFRGIDRVANRHEAEDGGVVWSAEVEGWGYTAEDALD